VLVDSDLPTLYTKDLPPLSGWSSRQRIGSGRLVISQTLIFSRILFDYENDVSV